MTSPAARRVADALGRRGLAVPGRLLVDAHRPLAPLLADVGAAVAPILTVAVGRRADDLAGLLADPDGMEDLAQALDQHTSGGTRADAG